MAPRRPGDQAGVHEPRGFQSNKDDTKMAMRGTSGSRRYAEPANFKWYKMQEGSPSDGGSQELTHSNTKFLIKSGRPKENKKSREG